MPGCCGPIIARCSRGSSSAGPESIGPSRKERAMFGFRPFACLCLLWAVVAATVGGPPNRVSGVARAMDDLTPDRFARRGRASLSLDGVERRKLVGRLV